MGCARGDRSDICYQLLERGRKNRVFPLAVDRIAPSISRREIIQKKKKKLTLSFSLLLLSFKKTPQRTLSRSLSKLASSVSLSAAAASALAVAAAQKALTAARSTAQEMDAVLVSTCTGYLCPGLTSYVSEQLSLRPDVFALDLVGQGCGAALPNFRAAEAILKSGRARKVLSICVEICSAAFYLDDDPGVLISACLFGDGAGAAVLSNEPLPDRRRVKWKSAASRLVTAKRDMLRFSHKNGMLRNILLPEVPQVASEAAQKLFSESLVAAGVEREQITGWILHTGGRDVIRALRDQLELTESDVRHSSAVLREFGNISSPTVYFVLERSLRDTVPDGLWWMSAFGAGFSCHGALLEIGK